MARVYGRKSAYLEQRDILYYVLSAAFPVLVLAVLYGILKIFGKDNDIVLLIAIAVLIILVIVFEPVEKLWGRRAGKYSRGLHGEMAVAKMLKDLPDTFAVFEDVTIGKNRGNIDFIVVGPPGIFLLEVKSHGGIIGYNGFGLTLNGKAIRDKDFFRQIHGEVWALKNYLLMQLGHSPYIHPVLVFANDYAITHFGYRPLRNVFIIQKEELPALFVHFPAMQYITPQQKIEQVLAKVVK